MPWNNEIANKKSNEETSSVVTVLGGFCKVQIENLFLNRRKLSITIQKTAYCSTVRELWRLQSKNRFICKIRLKSKRPN